MTWPLLTVMSRDIPWDLGDSVLNCWILQWGADHALRFLRGDFGAFTGYFNANIFYPAPLTFAYSEHLTAQVIQILPVYAVTGNIVLCYNLVFVSTFVLSGLGTYLLVRELTGSTRAAFIAGLFYAFAPYRIGQFSHVQVLSAQWMPFVLYGFRRYFHTRGRLALAGAAAALVAQNWSCGYFLLYFAPFVAAYVLFELVERGLWREIRVWIELGLAALVVAAATFLLLQPYLELRALGFGPRPFGEVLHFSADVFSYWTAHGAQHAWGNVARAFPKAEGDLFLSVTPLVLALVGLAAHSMRVWRNSAVLPGGDAAVTPALWRRVVIVVATLLLVSQVVAFVVILFTGGFDIQIFSVVLRVRNLARAFRLAALVAGVLLVMSRRARNVARGVPRSLVAFSAAAFVAAFLLSLGPIIFSKGMRIAGDGPYWWLYDNVPGYDGLRVPARVAMIVTLFLAVLGGYGAAVVERWFTRGRATAIVLALGVIFLAESTAAPVEMNGTWGPADLNRPPARLLTGKELPPVYDAIRALPASAAIIEFPFGDEQHDLRYMVASASHWRPLVNGYSGGAPASYYLNKSALMKVLVQPELAWTILRRTGASYAVVHEAIYLNGVGPKISAWLRAHGAREIGWFGSDRLFELPSR